MERVGQGDEVWRVGEEAEGGVSEKKLKEKKRKSEKKLAFYI